jgi:hypothetical protein
VLISVIWNFPPSMAPPRQSRLLSPDRTNKGLVFCLLCSLRAALILLRFLASFAANLIFIQPLQGCGTNAVIFPRVAPRANVCLTLSGFCAFAHPGWLPFRLLFGDAQIARLCDVNNEPPPITAPAPPRFPAITITFPRHSFCPWRLSILFRNKLYNAAFALLIFRIFLPGSPGTGD